MWRATAASFPYRDDVLVAVAAGEEGRERGAVTVGDQVMLGAGPAPVDGRRARVE